MFGYPTCRVLRIAGYQNSNRQQLCLDRPLTSVPSDNVFINKFTPAAVEYIGGALYSGGITSTETITEVIELTGAALLSQIGKIPGIAGNQVLYDEVIQAGQIAFAEAYKYVYFASIAFGSISIIAALFLGDISKYMNDHVAVVM